MKFQHRIAIIIFMSGAVAKMLGQASSTASRHFDLSSFYGVTCTNSSVAGARSTGSTLEVDSITAAYSNFSLSAVVRATSSLSSTDVSESNAAGGIKFTHTLGSLRIYGDALYGRAQLDFLNSGAAKPGSNLVYTQARSAFYMLGFGLSFDFSETLSLRFDQQFERLSIPVSSTDHGVAIPLTIGITYHLPYTRHGRPY